MLKKIDIKNFRKHTNSTFTFDDGMSVMRGANEAGKSTVLEAVAYALFGVKALRSSLAEAVTWGEPENTLKVVLELSIENTTYVVSRGKSGAEVNYDGGRVTGQTEVTTFIADKLRVDANGAVKLMLSTQMDIRGALEAGPKATTELIERLAEFDQIDHLIDVMQEKLTLGNTGVALAALAAAQTKLESVQGAVEPNLKAMQESVANIQAQVQVAQEAFATAKEADRAAQAASFTGQGVERERKRLQAKVVSVEEALSKNKLARESLTMSEKPEVRDPEGRIAAATRALNDLANASVVRRAYTEVQPLLGKQDIAYYPGEMNSLIEELDSERFAVTRHKATVAKSEVEMATLNGQLLLNSCTFCGKDFSDVPEVQTKNNATLRRIGELKDVILEAEARIKQAETNVAALTLFTKAARLVDSTVAKFAQYLDVDRRTVPSILTWKDEFVVHPAEEAVPDYSAEIARIKSDVKARADWERQVQIAQDEHVRLQVEWVDNSKALAELPKVDMAALTDAERVARLASDSAQANLEDWRNSLTTAKSNLERAGWDWARVLKDKADAEAALESASSNLKALEFNNALLKKVRAARPLIADKLWNLVLAAVSKYFSEMRGTRSVVTKTSEGFLVDGRAVGVLSGSTLDILGLAIRVALVRTFLPQAPFLVLDEPCASMDEARTQSLLGFLVAVGFKQTLVVTHEDVSESVADHILSVGA